MATIRELEAKVAALGDRVAELADERAIRELLARYCYSADTGRNKAYGDLYTEDGVFDIWGPQGMTRAVGKKQIIGLIADHKGQVAIENKWMHLAGNNVVARINGSTATVNSYNVTLVRQGDNIVVRTTGYNLWTLAKVKGKWLVKGRKRYNIDSKEYGQVLHATLGLGNKKSL